MIFSVLKNGLQLVVFEILTRNLTALFFVIQSFFKVYRFSHYNLVQEV